MSYQETTDLFNKEDVESEVDESDADNDDEKSDIDEEKSDIDEEEISEVDDDEDDEDIENEYDLEGGDKKKKLKGGAGSGTGKDTGTEKKSDESSSDNESGDDESSDDDDNYLQKFNQELKDDLILNFHPETRVHNYEEIKQLSKVTRNKNGIIVDELHKTIPILTKYEKTRILGQRTKQIESGGATLVQVPPNVIDSYLIAKLELEQKKIPFIIRRPLPNGGMEYWYVSDLENIY
jgi:DNA-directed RNA polymerase subunit K/omega